MATKSELMYRMDALRGAGIDVVKFTMSELVDTLTMRGGKPALIVSPTWLKLYNDNAQVRALYDKDKFASTDAGWHPMDSMREVNEVGPQGPTITRATPPKKEPEPMVSSSDRDDLVTLRVSVLRIAQAANVSLPFNLRTDSPYEHLLKAAQDHERGWNLLCGSIVDKLER